MPTPRTPRAQSVIEPNTIRDASTPNTINARPGLRRPPQADMQPRRGQRLGRATVVACGVLLLLGIGGLAVGSPDAMQFAELTIYGALGLSWTALCLALLLRGIRGLRRAKGLGIYSFVHEGAVAVGIGAVGLGALVAIILRVLGAR